MIKSENELIEIISRTNLIEYAKEKGLYVDMNNLSEKEKNNKNFKVDETKIKLTDEIMLNSYYM